MSNKRIFHIIISTLGLASIFSLVVPSALMKKEVGNVAQPVFRVNRAADGSETLVTQDELSSKIARSTSTNIGQSFELSISTGAVYYTNLKGYAGVIPNDSAAYTEFYEKTFKLLTLEEKTAMEEEWKELPEDADHSECKWTETIHFESYLYNIDTKKKDYAIPRELYRSIFYTFDIVDIPNQIINKWNSDVAIQTIAIPSTVKTISLDAFRNVPNTVKFYVEASEDLEGYEEGWNHGCEVEYNYNYEEEVSSGNQRISFYTEKKFGSEGVNYYFGSYKTEEIIPIKVGYKFENDTSGQEYFHEVQSMSFEGVGHLIGSPSATFVIDIPVEDGRVIDGTSLRICNIFKANVNVNKNGSEDESDWTYSLNLENPFDKNAPLYSNPEKRYETVFDLSMFYFVSFKSISTFAGYTSVGMNFDIVDKMMYETVKSSYYHQYKSSIDSGRISIRFRLTALSSASAKVTYISGGEEIVSKIRLATPVDYVKTPNQKNNTVSFMFKDAAIGKGFNARKVKSITILNLYITLDLFAKNGAVAKSGYSIRFGEVQALPPTTSAEVFDINLLVLFVVLGYTVAFAAASVAFYFYLKNKYKNDEFRRMRTKSYVKKALIAYAGSLIVILELMFIILRNTAFTNAVVSYNPADFFIIVFGVASLLVIGYFIRSMYIAIKANNERRKTIKLKLNEDVDDDGTK